LQPIHDSGTSLGDSGSRADAARPDSSVSCVPSTEICNGLDDDCDGLIDEAAAVELDCSMRVLHAASVCQNGKCVYLRECNPGFYNCDGHPENGCETACPCATGCEDSGADDAG
jgi:hypothetical protein